MARYIYRQIVSKVRSIVNGRIGYLMSGDTVTLQVLRIDRVPSVMYTQTTSFLRFSCQVFS